MSINNDRRNDNKSTVIKIYVRAVMSESEHKVLSWLGRLSVKHPHFHLENEGERLTNTCITWSQGGVGEPG